MQLHDRTIAQKTAEVQFFALGETDGRNHADRGRLGIDHADRRLVRDDGRDRLRRGLTRNDNHIQTDGANRSHGFQLFDLQTAASGCGNHACIFGDRNESAGQTADRGGCHHTALFDCVVEHRQRGSRTMRTALLQTNFFEDIRDGVADSRGRRE